MFDKSNIHFDLLTKEQAAELLQRIKKTVDEKQSPCTLYTRKQAAEFLGVKENTLAVWHTTRRYDLPMVKVGRLCKYKLSDLMDFLYRHTTPE